MSSAAPTVVQDELLSVLRTYEQENVAFESSTRGRRYRVLTVRPESATVERVDGGEAESVTGETFAAAAAAIRAAGEFLLSDLPGNRIQGATVAQASTLGLASDRKRLVDIASDDAAIAFFADHFASLRVDRSSGSARLYKPVVLETVVNAVAEGELRENRISFDWLLPRFLQRMTELGQEADERKAAYAFANLAGDVIWLLAYRPEAPPLDSSSPSPAMIRERLSHARLKDRLWKLLQHAGARAELMSALQHAWFTTPEPSSNVDLQEGLERVMQGYQHARTQPFGGDHPMAKLFKKLEAAVGAHNAVSGRAELQVQASVGRGNWAKVPWIAILGPDQTVKDGVYCVYLFRADMSGVYATFNQGVTRVLEQHGTVDGRALLRSRAAELRRFCDQMNTRGFSLDHGIDLRVAKGLGRNYESSTVAHKLYTAEGVPGDAELGIDLGVLVDAYARYLEAPRTPMKTQPDGDGMSAPGDFDIADGVEAVIEYLEGTGFIYQPWHVAQYITAVRTKPFTILAGITGTGKSKLPARVAEATGSECRLVPVRPDWTDSSDVLGYVDLQGTFRPGRVAEILRDAMNQDDRHWVCVIDEMNLARVEQYLAEILSHIEDRRPVSAGGFASGPVLSQALGKGDEEWAEVHLPSNLALVGTVNMDESAHGFSRKVLDRAFTLELSDVDLESWQPRSDSDPPKPEAWPNSAWHPRAIMLGKLVGLGADEIELVQSVIRELIQLNRALRQAQLQIGYRSRDEIALFVLHARDVEEAFRDRGGQRVDPLDLAVQMKVLPRIIGGSNSVRRVLADLLGWAMDGQPKTPEEVAAIVAAWDDSGIGETVVGVRYPRSAARLCLMWQRLEVEGFTSYWL